MSIAAYNVKQLGEVLGVSESMGYKLIRQMNAELTQKGFLVIRGRVSQAYVFGNFLGILPFLGDFWEPHQSYLWNVNNTNGGTT